MENRFDPTKDAANQEKHKLSDDPNRIVIPADPNDPEDGDVTVEGLDRGQRARLIRTTRTALDLSQTEFAARFKVPVGTLRDWEQARVSPPDFAVAYVRVIRQHPDMVAKAVA